MKQEGQDYLSYTSSQIKTDDSMDIEYQIEKQNELIDDLQPKTSKFRIGKTYFSMVDNKTIFDSTGPAKKRIDADTCYSCITTKFQKEKYKFMCEFCGNTVCEPCLKKERPFPKAKLDKEGRLPKGKICLLCDRRFLIKMGILEIQSISSKKEKELRALQKEVEKEYAELNLLYRTRKESQYIHIGKKNKKQKELNELTEENYNKVQEIESLDFELSQLERMKGSATMSTSKAKQDELRKKLEETSSAYKQMAAEKEAQDRQKAEELQRQQELEMQEAAKQAKLIKLQKQNADRQEAEAKKAQELAQQARIAAEQDQKLKEEAAMKAKLESEELQKKAQQNAIFAQEAAEAKKRQELTQKQAYEAQQAKLEADRQQQLRQAELEKASVKAMVLDQASKQAQVKEAVLAKETKEAFNSDDEGGAIGQMNNQKKMLSANALAGADLITPQEKAADGCQCSVF